MVTVLTRHTLFGLFFLVIVINSNHKQASLWGDELKLDNMYKNSLGGAHRITEFTKQHNESV